MYSSDGVAAYSAILASLKARIGQEEFDRVGMGDLTLHVWLRHHMNERPEFRRAYYELWAWEYHRYSGNYQKACEVMKEAGYSGIYWRNNMW